MNIIKYLTGLIEAERVTNKNPCPNYATEAAAEKVVAAAARTAAEHFTVHGRDVRSARYVVFFMPSWGRWVGAVDMTELLARSSSTGGYVGICGKVWSF